MGSVREANGTVPPRRSGSRRVLLGGALGSMVGCAITFALVWSWASHPPRSGLGNAELRGLVSLRDHVSSVVVPMYRQDYADRLCASRAILGDLAVEARPPLGLQRCRESARAVEAGIPAVDTAMAVTRAYALLRLGGVSSSVRIVGTDLDRQEEALRRSHLVGYWRCGSLASTSGNARSGKGRDVRGLILGADVLSARPEDLLGMEVVVETVPTEGLGVSKRTFEIRGIYRSRTVTDRRVVFVDGDHLRQMLQPKGMSQPSAGEGRGSVRHEIWIWLSEAEVAEGMTGTIAERVKAVVAGSAATKSASGADEIEVKTCEARCGDVFEPVRTLLRYAENACRDAGSRRSEDAN